MIYFKTGKDEEINKILEVIRTLGAVSSNFNLNNNIIKPINEIDFLV